MISNRQELKAWLTVERAIYYKQGDRWIPGGIREKDILWKHQTLLRKAEYAFNTRRRLAYCWFGARLRRLQNKYALHIPINTCGKGLHVMHLGPILLNGRVTIGENCALHINTAIVAGGTDDGVPTLGDGVVVGVGSVILGNIYVANQVAVGANAVVNKDISEPGIAVAGVPAQKISNNGRTAWNRNGNAPQTE